MKKFTAVFLLLVFLCNTAGILGLFLFLKQDNYEFVFSRNAKDLNLIHLAIPKSKKIQWEKENEIIYEGKYYDVFGQSEDAQNIYLTCYSDSKDENLTQALYKHLDESCSDSSKKKTNSTTLKITLEDFLMQAGSWNIIDPVINKTSLPSFQNTRCGFILVFSPPPDFIV